MVFSNINGVYSIVIDKENSCYLNLNNGNFNIELVNQIVDQQYSIVVSIGSYSTLNKTITLQDNYNGFKLYLKVKKNKLEVVSKTILWMKDKIFIKEQSDYNDELLTINKNVSDVIKNDYRYKLKNNILRIGVYRAGISYAFKMTLLKSNEYTYSFNDIVLSRGTFKRKRNLLILYDTALNYSFYSFIGNNLLEEIFFPNSPTILKIEEN